MMFDRRNEVKTRAVSGAVLETASTVKIAKSVMRHKIIIMVKESNPYL